MLLLNLFQDPALIIVFLLALALAISVHEAAHAWASDRLGDATARHLGRLTLNPLAHLDPIGTIMLLVVGFGWGKPVPVDESRLRSRLNIIVVALAGPLSNLLTAIVLGIAYRFVSAEALRATLAVFIFFNLALMIFNLIPIPPLDGSKILKLFVSDSVFYTLQQYGFVLVILLFFVLRFGSFGLSDLLVNGVNHLFQLVTGSAIQF